MDDSRLRPHGRTDYDHDFGHRSLWLVAKIPTTEIAKIVNQAIELGVTAIDTAPAYVKSEEGVGMALGQRRKKIFLSTKVLADTVEDAEKSLTKSFQLLKTDWFDLVYYHSAGDHDVEAAMKPDGVFSWLVKQKQAGKFRFLGISGHNRPAKFVPLLETGEVDVLLTLVNFVDRFTYGFDHKVLPVARKHNAGIVAMKVFGGGARVPARMRTRRLLRNWTSSTWKRRSAIRWPCPAWRR